MINKNYINIFFNWDPFLYNYQKYNCVDYWKDIIDNKKDLSINDHIFTCFEKRKRIF